VALDNLTKERYLFTERPSGPLAALTEEGPPYSLRFLVLLRVI